MGPENVVKTTVYLADLADFPRMNEVYARFLGKTPPARSTIQAAALPRGASRSRSTSSPRFEPGGTGTHRALGPPLARASESRSPLRCCSAALRRAASGWARLADLARAQAAGADPHLPLDALQRPPAPAAGSG